MAETTRHRKNKSVTTLSTKSRALGLLARREHSKFELARKLRQKGCPVDEIESGLQQLQTDGYLSDRRYTEAYVNMRMNRGYGPMRIMAELREKGVADDLANEFLNHEALDWFAVLQRQYTKKFGEVAVTDRQDKAKRIAYLQARGFKLDLIFEMLAQS